MTSTYFAPGYFAPSYFAGLFGNQPPPDSPPTPVDPVIPLVRDADIFRDITRILGATRQFSLVSLAEPPEAWGSGSQLKSLAVVIPGAVDESVGFDNPDASEVLRKVAYTLEIRVRDTSPAARFDLADRLCQVARRALNGVPLAGATYPPLTRLGADAAGKSAAPERVATLRGTFTYSIDDSAAGRDVAFA
jgi:hypothetical protein